MRKLERGLYITRSPQYFACASANPFASVPVRCGHQLCSVTCRPGFGAWRQGQLSCRCNRVHILWGKGASADRVGSAWSGCPACGVAHAHLEAQNLGIVLCQGRWVGDCIEVSGRLSERVGSLPLLLPGCPPPAGGGFLGSLLQLHAHLNECDVLGIMHSRQVAASWQASALGTPGLWKSTLMSMDWAVQLGV